MEREKRRLVTQTNPFITKLTENGIKGQTRVSKENLKPAEFPQVY